MLAGLPKAPSAYNPVTNPKRAKTRQLYVLRRMHDLRFLTDEQFTEAQTAPLTVRQGLRTASPTHAEFVAEMARQVVFEAWGEDAYTKGLTVWTTIRKADQEAAYAALRRGVFDYDRRHGYRGPEAYVSLPDAADAMESALERTFAEAPEVEGLPPAVVLDATPAEVTVDRGRRRDGQHHRRRPPLREPKPRRQGRACHPDPPRAPLSGCCGTTRAGTVSPSCRRSNRRSFRSGPRTARSCRSSAASTSSATSSTTSPRRCGSRGRASSRSSTRRRWRRDSPRRRSSTTRRSSSRRDRAGGEAWEPKNYDGKFEGPMRIRTALAKSKNLVTVRVLQAIGPQYAQDYIARFGFDPKLHPAYLTMGLGAGVGHAAADGRRATRSSPTAATASPRT